MEQQIIFTNKDISRMEISCPHCNEVTSVPVPAKSIDDSMNSTPWQMIVHVKKCPWCRATIDGNVANALQKLQDSFSSLSDEGVLIGFVTKK